MIKEIEGFNQVQQIKVLLLPKNKISKIKNLEQLQQLEVLDLHSNKIQKIEGLLKLTKLRILNLANNQINKIENLDRQYDLIELNLKINNISNIENIDNQQKLQKLFIQNNNISNLNNVAYLKNLRSLQEINLENNEVSINNRSDYFTKLQTHLTNIKTVDGKTLQNLKQSIQEELVQQQNKKLQEQKNNSLQSQTQSQLQDQNSKQSNNKKKDQNNGPTDEDNINADEVINIIHEQWKQEVQRVQNLTDKKNIMSNTCVEGGHAEIEDDIVLFIYGNAYDIVLQNEQFQKDIEKIQFQYVLFDFLIDPNILQYLKKFNKLKELVFIDNNITNLLQIAKLEVIEPLKCMSIQSNPITNCSFLKEFIVYRFPNLTNVNNKDVRLDDKNRAKNLFSNFDKILQLPEKYYSVDIARNFDSSNQNMQKSKKYMHQLTKQIGEVSEEYVKNLLSDSTNEENNNQCQFNNLFNNFIEKQIQKCLKIQVK